MRPSSVSTSASMAARASVCRPSSQIAHAIAAAVVSCPAMSRVRASSRATFFSNTHSRTTSCVILRKDCYKPESFSQDRAHALWPRNPTMESLLPLWPVGCVNCPLGVFRRCGTTSYAASCPAPPKSRPTEITGPGIRQVLRPLGDAIVLEQTADAERMSSRPDYGTL